MRLSTTGRKKKQRKYRNEPTRIDGRVFASKKEAKRYGELKLMVYAKEITYLTIQPRFELVGCNGKPLEYDSGRKMTYVADFSYYDAEGQFIIEDTKGFRTKDYKIKKAIMRSMGLRIREL